MTDLQEREDCELRWFVRGSLPSNISDLTNQDLAAYIHTIHVPVGPATFVIGDGWLTVAKGQIRMAQVPPGVVPRLATEADVFGGTPETTNG